MKELFLSYLFKLRHDLTFKITLIIGGGMAVLMTLIYLGLGALLETTMISGEMMLVSALSPTQNFGLAVPINLITFTVLEFNQGSIRNKIIAGHSKARIYTSLFLNGLIFTIALVGIYVLLSFGLGSIFGGFHPNGDQEATSLLTGGAFADHYLSKMIVSALFCYISIVSFTVFFSTLFRNIGPAIPVVIVTLIFLYLAGSLVSVLGDDAQTVKDVVRIIDPLYAIGASEYEEITVQGYTTLGPKTMFTSTFVAGIISNVVYAALFYGFGLLIFSKSDVK